MNQWFEVDRKGLAEVARRRGMAFIVSEPIQNAWDEDITHVSVDMEPVPGKAQVRLIVSDDSPDGFRDLADAYVMFRQSYKLANPEQRGRFNIGEKLLLAVADEARITSTTGSIIFGPTGRKTGRKRTQVGTVLNALLRMTRAEYDDALLLTRTLIPPHGITTTINGEVLPERTPLAQGERTLDTEILGEDGGFRYTRRKTQVRIYKVLTGETPHIYEMGIPVDEIECPWHIEVAQKVPLSVDRSSVRTGFRLEVERAAAEIMADQMGEDESRGGWVGTALETMEDEEAVRAIVKQRFGKAVIYDPSAPESNKLAVDAGYEVVHGRSLSKAAWQRVKDAGALQPAGQLFDKGFTTLSPDGVPPVPRKEWTDSMVKVADYARAFSQHTLGHTMDLVYYDDALLDFNAFCGGGTIAINLAQTTPGMGGFRRIIEGLRQEAIDRLLIHECAHDKVSDHLTHDYHRECCRIGARARSFEETL